MKDPAFKEKLLNEKPNFASEIEKSMNEQGSAKSQEEIKEAANLGLNLFPITIRSLFWEILLIMNLEKKTVSQL